MAEIVLTTYTGLKDAIAKWLNRTDLTDQIPAFIRLVEVQIARTLRRTTRRATVSIIGEAFTLPATMAEPRSIHLVSGSAHQDLPIYIVTPEMLAEVRASNGATAGRPRYASVIGRDLVFAPAPDRDYTAEIVYFEALVPLSSTNTSNVVLTEAPDAYLYGALKEAAPFLEHDERIAMWETKYNTAIEQLTAAREREEFNASLRPARLPRVFG